MLRFTSHLLLALLASTLIGCKSVETRADNENKSKLGVLIIAGEGLNSGYKDAWSSSFVFETSAKVAVAMQQEIQQRGGTAQLFLSRDRNVKPKTYLAELLSQDKRDGLLQINIIHKREDSLNIKQRKFEENYSITLSMRYNPLRWDEGDSKGNNVVTLPGPTADYSLVNDDSFKDERLKEYAKDFANRLRKEGFLGN